MSSRIEVGGIQGVPQVDASIPCMIVPREVLEGREVLAGDESSFLVKDSIGISLIVSGFNDS